MSLKGKIAIITGGAGALGGAISTYLAKQGVKMAILGRSPEKTKNKVKEIIADGGEAIALIADVLDRNQLEMAKAILLQKWGKIDILINAAGGNVKEATVMPDASFFEMPANAFSKVVNLNLLGTVLPIQVFAEPMKDLGKGCILNISSMAAQLPLTRVVGYSASKAAIDNLTKWLAVEMAQKYGEGIRVNAIAPGFFIGEQNRSLLLKEDGTYTDRAKTIISQTPMNRFGKLEELNGVVGLLCSDAASFITGIVIPIDGGFSAFSGV